MASYLRNMPALEKKLRGAQPDAACDILLELAAVLEGVREAPVLERIQSAVWRCGVGRQLVACLSQVDFDARGPRVGGEHCRQLCLLLRLLAGDSASCPEAADVLTEMTSPSLCDALLTAARRSALQAVGESTLETLSALCRAHAARLAPLMAAGAARHLSPFLWSTRRLSHVQAAVRLVMTIVEQCGGPPAAVDQLCAFQPEVAAETESDEAAEEAGPARLVNSVGRWLNSRHGHIVQSSLDCLSLLCADSPPNGRAVLLAEPHVLESLRTAAATHPSALARELLQMAEAAVPVRKAQLAAQAKEQRKMMRRQRSAADGAGQRKRPLRPAEAAARLQAHWRSVVARRRWRVLRRAARIIQRNWRRYLDAKRRERQRGFHLELRKMREKQTAKQELLSRHQKELAEIDQLPGRAVPAWERLNRTLAVVKFQARWRGIVARRRCEALRLRKRQAEAAALIQRAFRAHRLYVNRPKFADLVARFARVNIDEARVAELQRQVLDGRRPWLEKHRIDRLRCAPRPSLAETYRRAQELVDQRWRDRVRFNVASEQRTRLREEVASLYRQLTEGAAVDDALPPLAEAASMPWDPLDGIDEASRSAHRKALEQASKPWWKTLEPVQPI